MKPFLCKYCSILFLSLLLGSLGGFVQKASLTSSADRTEILIGEQVKVKLEASFTQEGFTTQGFILPDSIEHFEIIEKGKIDSIYSSNQLTGLVQEIIFTSFDSGKWLIPSCKFTFTAASNLPVTVYSDSLPITVSYSVADSTNRIMDIKPIRQAEAPNTLWYWLGAAATLLFIIFIVWRYYKYWKKKQKNISSISSLSPYEEARKALQSLQQYNLTAKQDVVAYHRDLKEILKKYLSLKTNVSFLNRTTADILLALKDKSLDQKIFIKTATSLRCSDAVQFAKYLPGEPDSVSCMLAVKELIDTLENKQ